MKFKEKDIQEISTCNGILMRFKNEDNQIEEIWFNCQNIQNILFNRDLETISIIMSNSEKYEIISVKNNLGNLIRDYVFYNRKF